MLTVAEIRLILEALMEKYGRGYSSVPEVSHLQAKLSIMSELASKKKVTNEYDDESTG